MGMFSGNLSPTYTTRDSETALSEPPRPCWHKLSDESRGLGICPLSLSRASTEIVVFASRVSSNKPLNRVMDSQESRIHGA